MDVVRCGLVGCGFFGGGLARIINQLEGMKIVAVHGGSRTEMLAREFNCVAVENLEDLVSRDDIDAILVASPSNAHKDPVIQAAKYGKHVFCEKPAALSLQDCDEMIAACRSAQVHFMIGHIMHFMSGIRTVKRLISSGEIGTPIVCHAERTGWENKKAAVSWKKNKSISGGHLFHHIHDLDILQSILGPATAVCTAGGNLAHNGEGFGDEDDVLLLTMAFARGAFATMQYGSGFRWGEHYMKINGTEGAIKIDMKRSKIELKKNNQITAYPLYLTPEADAQAAKDNELQDSGITYGTASTQLASYEVDVMREEMAFFRDVIFCRPVDNDLRLLLDGTSARSSIATAEAAMNSLKEKTWVRI